MSMNPGRPPGTKPGGEPSNPRYTDLPRKASPRVLGEYSPTGPIRAISFKNGKKFPKRPGSFTAVQKNFGPVVKKNAPAATLYIGGLGTGPLDHRREEGRDGVSETMQACLRRHKVLRRNIGLSTARQAYVPQKRLIQAVSTLSMASHRYPGRDRLLRGENQVYMGQRRVIYEKSDFPAPIQPSPPQNKVLRRD